MDIYLKAKSEAALYEALEAAGVVTQGEDGWHVTDGHKYALDVIGVIYKPTGKMLDTDMGEVPETAPLPGYHANLRVMTADFDPESLADLACNPKAPARGWA
jgi:hypothetical protein